MAEAFPRQKPALSMPRVGTLIAPSDRVRAVAGEPGDAPTTQSGRAESPEQSDICT